jgi:hypothetical protein
MNICQTRTLRALSIPARLRVTWKVVPRLKRRPLALQSLSGFERVRLDIGNQTMLSLKSLSDVDDIRQDIRILSFSRQRCCDSSAF